MIKARQKRPINSPPRHRAGPAASLGLAALTAQVQDLREELEVERQFHEGFLDSQRELEVSRERYSNLYDLAPVGYLTLDSHGLIHEANLKAAEMLGRQRAGVLDRPLQVFVAKADRREILRHFSAMRQSRSPVITEVMLAGKGAEPQFVELRTVPSDVGMGIVRSHRYYAVLTDITERKRAEMQLRRQRAEIQTLLENTPAGLVLFEAVPPYKVLAHNRYYQELFAEPFRDKGMVGLNIHDYSPAVEAEGVAAIFDEVVRTGQPRSFIDFPYKSDPPSQSWFNWHMSPVFLDGQIVALVSMSLDVTDRHRAEEALRESEEKYRNLFENIADEVHFWRLIRDEAGQIKTWRLVDINPAGLKGWRKTRAETIGKTADEIFPGATAHFMPVIQKIMAEGLPQTRDTYFPALGYHLRFTSVPLGEYFITTGFDISEVKKAEKVLRDSNAELEQRVAEQTAEIRNAYEVAKNERQRLLDVLETLPVILMLLRPDFRVVWTNRACREALGDNVGSLCYAGQFGRNAPCDECQAFIPLATGQMQRWQWTLPDGRIFDICNFPFTDTDGSPMILEMDIDITERKRAERELQQAHAELEARANQLRALATELAMAEQRERTRLAMVLHDGLQQMLVAAKFQIAMVERSPSIPQATAEVAAIMDDCIEMSRSLTAELSPPILHQSGLIPALEWLMRWVRDRHGLSVKLVLKGEQRRPNKEIESLLYQSIRELLLNVIKHAGTKHARVQVTQLSGRIRVEVSDDGRGFDPEQTVLNVNGDSLGMGLFSVRERLGYLGGTMEIAAAPGRGAKFILIAPTMEESNSLTKHSAKSKASHGIPVAPEAKKVDTAKIRVVLVDDHRVMRQGLATLLGVEPDISIVGEASDGKSAVDLVLSMRPAVVLMDIGMPGMDGIEATRLIHEQMPEVKIIGLSMFQENEQGAAIIAAGASKYLEKTGPSELVLAAIRDCLQTDGSAPVK